MRKLAIAVFGFSVAIFCSRYFVRYDNLLIYAGIALVLSLFAVVLTGNMKIRVLIIFLSLCAGFVWFFTYTTLFIKPHWASHDEIISANALVTDFPVIRETRGYYVDVTLLCENLPAVGARLYYNNETILKPGDNIYVSGRFRRTDISDDGKAINSLSSRGIFQTAYISGNIVITDHGSSIRHTPKLIANSINDKIKETFADDVSHFLQALLIGKRDDLYRDNALSSSLSASGIIHVVSISGMHISFLMGFLALVIKNKRLFALYGIPVLLLFMAMTGFTPAVTRAGIMQIFIIFAPLLRRDSDTITSLSAAMLVILVINPYACTSAGLHLSFSATLGIVLFTSGINHAILDNMRKSKAYKKAFTKALINYASANLSTTIGALIFTIPLSAIHFGYISLIAPLTNLLTIGIISLIFPIGLVITLLSFLSTFLAALLAFPVDMAARYILFITYTLSSVPYSVIYSSNTYIISWLAYIYVLFITISFFKPRPRQYLYPVCISVILLLCVIFASFLFPLNNNDDVITVLDVGQGLSVVISSGDSVMIVDCGSSSGRAGETTHEYLQNHGHTKIDLIALTHFHADHVNGVEFLLSRVNVSALAVPDPDGSFLADDIINLARRRQVDIIYVTDVMKVSLGELEITLFPPLGFGDENERGLTVLTTGSLTALITGDMNSSSERSLLRAYQLPKLDILIVGHHGSRNSTSEELLTHLRPDTALISVGRNSFGHPHKDTLERLTQFSTLIYRTDETGYVSITGR